MLFNISIALNWILFLALFPITFFWLRRVWRIVMKRDFSEVALKRGESPANPARYAPYTAAINLVGAAVILYVIFGVLVLQFHFDTWTAIAGSTIWMKFIADFVLSRQAHPIVIKKRNKADGTAGEEGK